MEQNAMRAVRQAHDLTQNAMAQKLGCSVLTVKRSEKDGKLPRSAAVLRNLKALATLASIEIEDGAKETAGSAA